MSSFLPFTRPSIDEQTVAEVAEVLRSGWLASGPKVKDFEAALSAYFGGRPVRTQTSATASLEHALLACGIGAGDEVIVPAMSFVASANVVVRTGARPVFVDVDLDTRSIDLDQAEAAISARTRAIMPVHLSGLAVDLDRVYALAER
ncbi:DegT/DnrJ/EryC1/StrS aminotransferase, partial [mine drainage metagenome]